jgi:hypothetical protein
MVMPCEFPAKQLLKMRREAALSADKIGEDRLIRETMEFVLAIDQLRLAHEALTGCQCWYSRESNREP